MAEGDFHGVIFRIPHDLENCTANATRYVLDLTEHPIEVEILVENAAGVDESWYLTESDFDQFETAELTLMSQYVGQPTNYLGVDEPMARNFSGYTLHLWWTIADVNDDVPELNNMSHGFHGWIRFVNHTDDTDENHYQDVPNTASRDGARVTGGGVTTRVRVAEYELESTGGAAGVWEGMVDSICPTDDDDLDLYILMYDWDQYTSNDAEDRITLGIVNDQEKSTPSGEEDLGSLYFGGGYTGGNLGKGLGKGFVARW